MFQATGDGAALGTVARQLAGVPGLGYIEPIQYFHAGAISSDPKLVDGTMWGLTGKGIQAQTAWNVTTGATKVIVADIDTGMDYNHPDLYQNVWLNQAEIPATRLANLTTSTATGSSPSTT